jgi:hypothetical protein
MWFLYQTVSITNLCAYARRKPIDPSELPYPSPSQPTLGKRTRGLVDTPDVSLNEDGTEKQPEDPELAFHRVIKPLRKRARLELDADEDAGPFSLFGGGPVSTSTPQHPPNSPAGFFTAGRRAPTPHADADLPLDSDESGLQRATTQLSAVAAQLSTRAAAPVNGAPRTPSSATAGPSTDPVIARNAFFNGLRAPVYLTPATSLPFPLVPTTPARAHGAQERSASVGTPVLAEPWKFEATVNTGDDMGSPPTPTHVRRHASPSNAAPLASPGNQTFRAGGRRKREDPYKLYKPYFIPQPGPGDRDRTGITPTYALVLYLKSLRMLAIVPESTDPSAPEEEQDGIVRSR